MCNIDKLVSKFSYQVRRVHKLKFCNRKKMRIIFKGKNEPMQSIYLNKK